ncbi:S8 family serine peptidase [Lysobacter terrae]
MDPALQELLAAGEATDEVAIVLRLREPSEVPPGVRIVARFGPIATARVERAAIWQIYGHPSIASLKAPSWLALEYGPVIDPRDAEATEVEDTDARRPDGLAQRGRGVVIGVIDWGADLAHPEFILENGTSRIQALWDQRADPPDGNPYGYGRVLGRDLLTAALRTDDPYATAGYHPAASDTGAGAHGTHVLSIAAGNGRSGGPLGIAPDADLVFVHLGSAGWEKAGPLGDSSNLLEALHFLVAQAGDRPLVVNMSIGRHAGPHDGTTLVEQAIDWLVRARPGTAVVQSAGNYFSRNVHSAGQLMNGESDQLGFEVFVGDTTPNELEVWYPGRDIFSVAVIAPNGRTLADIRQGDKASLEIDGKRIGTLYTARDPNNDDHHIHLFLYTSAPPGTWRVVLRGEDVSDGRYHAWVERDPGCAACQALFLPDNANHRATTGSITNGLLTFCVGAYDAHAREPQLAPFSSSGPTRDGRVRPVLLAPGVRVLAARSHPRTGTAPLLTRMSGTSMAAPHVAGTIALMFDAGGRLPIVQLRRALFDSLAPRLAVDPHDRDRIGFGVLDIAGAVRRARELALPSPGPPPAPPPAPPPMPESTTEDHAMKPDCCGDPCKDCTHCRDHDCATCACCHTHTESVGEAEVFLPDAEALLMESESQFESHAAEAPLIQVVPSPLETASPADVPLIQVVPSPLTGASRTHAHHHHEHETEQESSELETAIEQTLPHPVEAAEALVEAGIDDATEFVSQTLAAVGREWPPRCTVRSLFDDLTGRTRASQRLRMDRYFEVIGRPGRRLATALQSGDLVLRRGDSGFAHGAFIAHPALYSEPDAHAHGLRMESPWPGFYVHVVEAGARPQRGWSRFARRVCLPDWTVLPDTLVVRSRAPGAAWLEGESVETAPDPNVSWLQRVLNQCIGAALVVDGLYGPATRDAIRRFQAARGLQTDGIVGPQTLGALRAEGHEPPPGYRPPPPYTPPSYPSHPSYSHTPPSYPSHPSYSHTPPPYRPRTPVYEQPSRTPPPYRPTTPPSYSPPPSYPPPPSYAPPPYGPPSNQPPSYPPSYPGPAYPSPPPTGYPQPPYPSPPPSAYGKEDTGICRNIDRFGYDSAALTMEHRRSIQTLAQRILDDSVASVSVTGYASPEGTASYNLMLGQRRADAVAAELRAAMERVHHGSANTVRIQTRSEGESQQIAGDSGANRRVEVCYAETPRPTPRPQPQPPQPGPGPQPPTPPPRPSVMTRYDVATPQGQAMLLRYEEAVRRMMTLPDTNPLSWNFQWYTHAVPHPGGRAQALQDTFHGTASPARTLASRVWSTCRAHFNSAQERDFLPWHRGYVLLFERICRRVLQDDSFTLPYWDYLGHPSALPARFRDPSNRVLFRPGRTINGGQQIAALSSLRAYEMASFSPRGVRVGFNSELDYNPHGLVHNGTGGPMGPISMAASDPIFWLHHCNIDRMWASWNNAGRSNPRDPAWLNSSYTFADENGREVSITAGMVSSIATLGYAYDRLDALPSAVGPAEAVEEEPDRARAARVTHRAGAPQGIALGSQTIQVNLRTVARPPHEAADDTGQPKRLYLVLRNFRANHLPGVVYYIYLQLPPGTRGEAAERHFVGPLHFFGATPHPGNPNIEGKTHSFDITDIAERLRAAGMLQGRPTVTFAPAGQPAANAQPVIGDIALVEE